MNRLFVFALALSTCFGYYIEIDANVEECFYETIESGRGFILHYEVAEGGFLDIDVQVYAPDGAVLYSEVKKSNGRPKFFASKSGDYKYCLSNKMSSLTPKVVLFEMEVEEDHLKAEEQDDDAHKKLITMLNSLSHSVESVKLEMEYVALRTNIHWNINQDTNFRVVLWAAFEALLIITMSIGQVFYLKRFFEVRRLV